jgi:hypothetical protein
MRMDERKLEEGRVENVSKVYVCLLKYNARHTMTMCRILRRLQMQGLIVPCDVTGKLDYGSYSAIGRLDIVYTK